MRWKECPVGRNLAAGCYVRIGPAAWGPISLTNATDKLNGWEYVCKMVWVEGLDDVLIDLGGAQHLTCDSFCVPASYVQRIGHDLEVLGLLAAYVEHRHSPGHRCCSSVLDRRPALMSYILRLPVIQHWRIPGPKGMWNYY